MNERLGGDQSEWDDPKEVFDVLARIRTEAQSHRQEYLDTLKDMNELCKELKGVELLITGRLYGRGGTTVYRDDPKGYVENLHVRVGSAKAYTYEDGGISSEKLPCIDITAWTVENNELVCAWLGVGESGVKAELVQSTTVQT